MERVREALKKLNVFCTNANWIGLSDGGADRKLATLVTAIA
jgi:hypothetical protein